ncbi:MAG: AsmA family protein [Betaproteobacteria bacterium]
MSLLPRILLGVGALLLLLLGAIAVAIYTVDVKTFIGPIRDRVRATTGREFNVNGAIDFKFSLEPTIVLGDATLGNAPWGKAPQMIAAKRVEVRVALLPLLSRDFQVRDFTLIEPVISLETDARGTGNWEFAKSAPGTSAAATPSAAATSGGLFVSKVSIANGTLTYRDGVAGTMTTAKITDFAFHARDPQSTVTTRFLGGVDDIAVALDGEFGPLTSLAQRQWPYPIVLKGKIADQQFVLDTKLRIDGATVHLDPLVLEVGKSKLAGQVSKVTGKLRPKYSFNLTAKTMALADFAAPWAGQPGQAGATVANAARSRYLFSDAPINLSALRASDANGELAADSLVFPDGRRLDKVHLQFTLNDGVLDAPVVQAGAFGGTIVARVKLDAGRDKGGSLNLRVDAKGLELAQLLAEAGVKRQVQGGKTSVSADIAARGASLHQWAGSANGNVLVMVGPATMGQTSDNHDAAFNKLSDAVNPFRKVDASTELLCAVIRLPLAGGVAKVDRSIGVETNKLGANANGALDFRNETMDLSIKPQIRKGITLNVDRFASLVRIHGPFSAPTVGVDAMASAATVATIGAAISTGGISLVGQSLLSSVTADTGAPCQVALGRGGRAPDDASASRTSGNPAQELGSALGKLFKR